MSPNTVWFVFKTQEYTVGTKSLLSDWPTKVGFTLWIKDMWSQYKVVDGSSKKGKKILSLITNSPICYWGYCVECHGHSWNHDEKNGDDWDDFRRQWSVGLFQKVPQKLLVATATRVFEHIRFLKKKSRKIWYAKFKLTRVQTHSNLQEIPKF